MSDEHQYIDPALWGSLLESRRFDAERAPFIEGCIRSGRIHTDPAQKKENPMHPATLRKDLTAQLHAGQVSLASTERTINALVVKLEEANKEHIAVTDTNGQVHYYQADNYYSAEDGLVIEHSEAGAIAMWAPGQWTNFEIIPAATTEEN